MLRLKGHNVKFSLHNLSQGTQEKKSHFLITGSSATLDVSSYVQSCNMGFVAEKKKKLGKIKVLFLSHLKLSIGNQT